MTEAKNWAWKHQRSEVAHGLFATRDDAVEDAIGAGCDAAYPVLVGRAAFPDPAYFGEHIADADLIVERMDEAVADGVGEFYHDRDQVFDLRPGGQDALEKILGAWAAVYVELVGPWTLRDGDCETVEIRASATAADGSGDES